MNLFAESPSIPLDTLAGGGVTGMLVAVMYAFLKRTKDTDERRDAATSVVVEAAREAEKRAWVERDRALAERDAAREEITRLRAQLEAERVEARERLLATEDAFEQQLRDRRRPRGKEDPR